MSGAVRAIFFDLGGTLFSYGQIGLWTIDALKGAAARLGVEARTRDIVIAYRDASEEAGRHYLDQSFYLHRDLFRDTFRAMAERLGRESSDSFLDETERDFREALVGNMVLRDDCLSTLGALRERGLYLSIVSNIDDDYLIPMVDRTGLDAVLDHWTSSEEARSCKPDSRFFYVSIAKAGCTAREVLFVGDSLEHDVVGANRVGMRSALIVDENNANPLGSGEVDVAPDHEIESLAELLELVAG